MKIACFHLMPYRDLPDDFEHKHKSAWFSLPFSAVGDARKVAQYYNWTLDELIFAAEAGFDGVCTNEHHQNAYGFMVNPNMMGSVLARATRGTDVAIVQMGETAVFLNPPIRVAEEYAMLDCISEGRLVAGFPVGLGGDFSYSYGMAPMEQRGRYYEAHDLIKKAWTAREGFAWNGRYYQLPMVNIWPQCVQTPHPPIWVPGNASPSTWDFVIKNDYSYCFLTYFGAKGAQHMVNGFWNRCEELGRDRNPYRMGFLVPVGVADTDAEAGSLRPRHRVLYHGPAPAGATARAARPHDPCEPLASHHQAALPALRRAQEDALPAVQRARVRGLRQREDRHRTPARHRQDTERRPLMLLPQFGSLSHAQTMDNIARLGRDVLPQLRGIWDDTPWVDHWWPRSRHTRRAAA